MSMRRATLMMPRLNANEDEGRVVLLPLGTGQTFTEGTLLFALETTKAAIDVIAPCTGTVHRVLVQVGETVSVGSPVCEVELADGASAGDLDLRWADDITVESGDCIEPVRHASVKARERARELGVNIDEVRSATGHIRVRDVENHAHDHCPAATVATAIRKHYANSDAIIFGGGGHARAVADAAAESGFNLIGAVDRAVPAGTLVIGELRVLGDEGLLEVLRGRGLRFAFIGVGGATTNAARQLVFERLSKLGFELPPLVSRAARLGMGSTVGAATYCLPGANIGPAVTIGDNCIINQNVVIAHDSTIEDHVHLAPNAVVAGHCHVGQGSTVGMCATLINGSRVGAECLIHNNVPVTSNVPNGTVLALQDVLGRTARSG